MIGRVYRINVNENDFYIGSTTTALKKRERSHNKSLKRNIIKNKLYEKCREHNITKIGCLLLEDREVEYIDEIRQLEQEYITNLQPTLNSYAAYTGFPKEDRKQYFKEYRDNNIETIREYYINNREKISKQKKEYREKNLETITEYKKEYYKTNKAELNQEKNKKINCPICNSIVRKGDIARHKKTIKCLSYKTI